MFLPPPKRPHFYLYCFFMELPNWTRDVIEYMGDYIDLLSKALLFDKTKDDRMNHKSLGPVIAGLKSEKYLPDEMIENLVRYNKEFYRPAKHDIYSVNIRKMGRRKRFTVREAVYCAFITKKLAEELKKNEYVTKVSKEEVDFDNYEFDRISLPFNKDI